jgi:hypothetical protein
MTEYYTFRRRGKAKDQLLNSRGINQNKNSQSMEINKKWKNFRPKKVKNKTRK